MKEEKLVEARCLGKNWVEEYKRRIVSAEEAVKVVKSGDRVIAPWFENYLSGGSACRQKGAAT